MKKLESKVQSKVENLINTQFRVEMHEKLEVLIDAFDAKLRKVNAKVDHVAEVKAEVKKR